MSTSNASKRERSAKKSSNKPCKIFRGMIFNMLKYAFLMLRVYVERFIDYIFSLTWEAERKKIPDLEAKHAILAESAVSLAAKIRSKEITSAHLVGACIERIKAVNPFLNAMTDERFQDALKEAKEIDEKIQEGLSDEYFNQRPFLGVPFTTKDSTAVESMRHTLGILSRSHLRASDDADCVARLREAGAIPLALTNVPEINKWQETRNMVFGQTNNPHHTGRTTGGSSGGEAALAAALASPISLCSDIGGSTRMPAFYCGLYALNPTAGTTNLKGIALRTGNAPTIASVGFVSKHCSDLAPLTKLVLKSDTKTDLQETVNIKDIRYFYTETAKDLRVSSVSKDLKTAMKRAIMEVTELAPTTDRAPKPYYHKGFNYMYSLWRHAMTREVDCFPKMLANNQGEVNGLIELGKKVFGLSQFTLAAILKLLDEQLLPAVDRQWADTLTQELVDDLTATLGDSGVLLFPSAPAAAPYHYVLYLRPFNFAYWGIFNAIKFPAAQVPLGLDADGIPLGIQVVAAPGREALCLAVAEHLGKKLGGYVPPCKVPQ